MKSVLMLAAAAAAAVANPLSVRHRRQLDRFFG
jgi:hypothetical protein